MSYNPSSLISLLPVKQFDAFTHPPANHFLTRDYNDHFLVCPSRVLKMPKDIMVTSVSKDLLILKLFYLVHHYHIQAVYWKMPPTTIKLNSGGEITYCLGYFVVD